MCVWVCVCERACVLLVRQWNITIYLWILLASGKTVSKKSRSLNRGRQGNECCVRFVEPKHIVCVFMTPGLSLHCLVYVAWYWNSKTHQSRKLPSPVCENSNIQVIFQMSVDMFFFLFWDWNKGYFLLSETVHVIGPCICANFFFGLHFTPCFQDPSDLSHLVCLVPALDLSHTCTTELSGVTVCTSMTPV